MKILVVEDEDDTRNALVSVLKRRGYNMLEASKGAEAISIIEKEKPDIVFLDIQLADKIDGMEVLRKSKEISPHTEVIMMSAYQTEYDQQAQELGAYHFLKKPIVKIDLFINLIEEIRKKKNLASQN